jgi:hypothetical protein
MPITVTTEDTTGPISGIEGNLSLGGVTVANLRKWSIKKSAEIKKYASNDTAGAKKTLKGVKEWSGSADIYIEQGTLPALEEGKLYAFSGTLKTGGTAITGVVRISEVSIDTDIETGDPIGGTVSFEGHGALVQGT